MILPLLLSLGLPMAALQPSEPIQLPAQAVLESKFLVATSAMNPDATLNVVIDQPLGGSGKTAPFLALGRIPRSILPSGEPVTAIVVGGIDPGATMRGRVLGMLTRVQDGRTEYRVLLVPPDGPCGHFTNLNQMQAKMPVLRMGFRLAFGPTTGSASFTQQGCKEGARFVADAVTAFERAWVKESDQRPLGQDGNPTLDR